MTKGCKLIPSIDAFNAAEARGLNVMQYIQSVYNGAHPLDAHKSGDNRLRDVYGNELIDLLITRADGSKFRLHEDKSEIEELQKLTISPLNDIGHEPYSLTVYSENMDFVKLQNDQEYLNAVKDSLLSERRLSKKSNEAAMHGNHDYMYVGFIDKKENGKYGRFAYTYDSVAPKIDEARKNIDGQNQNMEDR